MKSYIHLFGPPGQDLTCLIVVVFRVGTVLVVVVVVAVVNLSIVPAKRTSHISSPQENQSTAINTDSDQLFWSKSIFWANHTHKSTAYQLSFDKQ